MQNTSKSRRNSKLSELKYFTKDPDNYDFGMILCLVHFIYCFCFACIYFSRFEKVKAPSYRHLVTREKAPKAATLAALQLLV